jgi:hypothetical protein
VRTIVPSNDSQGIVGASLCAYPYVTDLRAGEPALEQAQREGKDYDEPCTWSLDRWLDIRRVPERPASDQSKLRQGCATHLQGQLL